jgi:hypothetical protein
VICAVSQKQTYVVVVVVVVVRGVFLPLEVLSLLLFDCWILIALTMMLREGVMCDGWIDLVLIFHGFGF